ncbi:MAG: hypothetical protein WCA77_04100 [Thermoplasmata archaeon]
MASRPGAARSRAVRAVLVSAVLVLTSLAFVPGDTRATTYPPLPLGDDGRFLSPLSAPSLAPATSGEVTVDVRNPLSTLISGVNVALALYAFNAYPGNATGPLPAGSPEFTTAQGSDLSVQFTIPSIAPGGSASESAGVSAPGGAPSGAYAVRTSVGFSSNGSAYLLESRGFFSAAVWANATTGPGGTSVLNLTRLGVSGIVPETAVMVTSSSTPYVLYGILALAILVAGVAAFLAYRGGPGSRSGTRTPPDPHSAPSALGKSRTNDGD